MGATRREALAAPFLTARPAKPSQAGLAYSRPGARLEERLWGWEPQGAPGEQERTLDPHLEA